MALSKDVKPPKLIENNVDTQRPRRPYFTGRHSSMPEFLTDDELEKRDKRNWQYMQATAKNKKREEKASTE